MYSVLYTIQFIGVIVGFITVVLVYIQKSSENQKALFLSICCGFISMLAYYFEIGGDSFGEVLLAIKFGYVGKSFAVMAFLMFITKYCQVKIPRVVKGGLLVVYTSLLCLVLTCEKHKLYYSSLEFVNEGLFPHMRLGKGPFYYVFMVVTVSTMIVFATICFVKFSKSKGEDKRRMFALALVGISPELMLIIYLTGVTKEFDLVPMGTLLACVLLAITVIRYGLYDTIQMAKENIVENNNEGVLVVDREYNFLYANPTAVALFPDLEAKEDFMINNVINKVFSDGNRVFQRGDRHYEVRTSEIKEGRMHRGYMAWIFDMTFINSYTNEMITLKEEAEQANRSKTTFLTNMSHEIRTPMNSILGFTDIILSSDIDDTNREYMEYIKFSAESLLQIINDVLDFSKIESGKYEVVASEYGIKEIYQNVVANISPEATKKGLKLLSSIDDMLPYRLSGDCIKIQEILCNLLSNAVKYTNEGYIKLSVELVSIYNGSAKIKFVVQDTGIGIKEEDQTKIFEKFQQVDLLKNKDKEGTGLGLAIAKGYVSLLGGEIELFSSYGEGTTFVVYINQEIADGTRIVDVQNVTTKVKKYDMDAFKLKDANILIVDDNIINLKVAKSILERYGVEADTVNSGAASVEMVKEKLYDIIFMDQMMPELDGIETMKLIREIPDYNTAPIIMLTANAVKGVKEDMISEGFSSYIAKPIDIDKLERIILEFMPSSKVILNEKASS